MDDPSVPAAELGRALGYIRGVNRVLGGRAALIRTLAGWLGPGGVDEGAGAGEAGGHRAGDAGVGGGLTLLDVGTGSADLPVHAVRWARQRGIRLRVTGIDAHETTLGFAAAHARGALGQGWEEWIELRRADALALDAAHGPASFDYVHAGLFLHHLSDEDGARVLRSMGRIARRGLIWNDLVRSWAGLAVVRVLTLGQPAMVRHDARVSVEAGFTRGEALALASRAGLAEAAYRWDVWTHRFVLTWRAPEGGRGGNEAGRGRA